MAGIAQFGAQRRRALVLPGEQRRQRLAAPAVPDDAGFALRAEADRGDVGGQTVGQRGGDRLLDARPDLLGVLLDPAGIGGGLRDRDLAAPDDLPAPSTKRHLVELVP